MSEIKPHLLPRPATLPQSPQGAHIVNRARATPLLKGGAAKRENERHLSFENRDIVQTLQACRFHCGLGLGSGGRLVVSLSVYVGCARE